MLFSDLAVVWERARLGGRVLHQLAIEEQAAAEAYTLLFPKETLTERKVLSKVASELNVPYEVLREMLGTRASLLLASESSASNPSDWSLEDALRVRDAVMESDYSFLPLSKQMGEIEARLFWASVIGEKSPFTSLRFLDSLNPEVSPDTISSSREFLSDEEIITALYTDVGLLFDPKYWYDKPTAALRKRRYTPWSKYKSVDLEMYQAIPNNGVVMLEYNEEEDVIIEKAGRVVTDVAYPKHPELHLKERLLKYSETHDDEIAWPQMISSWESIVKHKETIRFPITGAFSPTEYGGYMLVKQSHIHNLRLGAYRNDEHLEIRVQALDGATDFRVVGQFTVQIPSERAAILFDIDRRVGANTNEPKRWRDIPENLCIVIRVSSPFLDRRTDTLSTPAFVEINSEMGISEVVQYVDLVGVKNE